MEYKIFKKVPNPHELLNWVLKYIKELEMEKPKPWIVAYSCIPLKIKFTFKLQITLSTLGRNLPTVGRN